MDSKALYKIGYGLYLLSTASGMKDNGCIVNTFVQLTSSPATVMLAVNKGNYSTELISKTGLFNISVLTEDVPFDLIKRFGYSSGRDTDKYSGFGEVTRTGNGLLRLTAFANAWLSLRVTDSVDAGTHTVFYAEVTDAEVISSLPSVTYSYYQTNIKPAPAARPAEAKEKTVWRCTVCGYEYEGDELPADFECPICKHGPDAFEKIGGGSVKEEKQTNNIPEERDHKMKKWKCTICGEIVISDKRPESCPLCRAPGDKFVEVTEEERFWATEHVIGIAKDAPADIIEGLRSNFQGECTEVGMYLAMSRAAAREGYPEIAEYWKTAAFEEAEHAAKFAELLGEVVSESTAKNLAVRVEAENGATQGKFELAKKAKALGLDAIHDTVHEMAKDEARHGKAFEGLLKRYFGK